MTIIILQVSVGVWNAGKNNMGFGMNRHTWNLIRNCSEVGFNTVALLAHTGSLWFVCAIGVH